MSPGDGHSVRVFVTGFHPSISDLCDALGRQHDIEFVGAAGHVSEAARALAAHDVDVVVHAISTPVLPRADLTEIREYTNAPVVLLTESSEAAILDEALDADIDDVVLASQPAERLAFTVRKAARATVHQIEASRQRQARVITVFSPKGGTGKTVISTNLATAIAKYDGARTLLLDLDLQFGDAAIMLNVEPEHTLHDLAAAPGTLDAEKLGGYVVRHAPSGLDVLAAPLRPEEGEVVTDQKVEHLLQVARPVYDVIVVDTSPSFHGAMLSALDRTDVLLLVAAPEVPTLKNVRLGSETLRRLAFPPERVKLVLNRSDPAVGMRKPDIEAALSMPVSYELPTDPGVPVAVNEGTPLTLSSPGSAFALAVRSMSASLLARNRAKAAWSDLYAVNADGPGLASTVRGLAAAWLPGRNGKSVPDSARTSA
jgi:pilus assembly protein CpaE